ncbi:serine/threonine-protein kinase [Mesorhizobium sp.]|uniref:serine/threonine-protein kinase n=2 Tax=Mesorhizobium sp. TaxID=1871066 RepID=UPI000FE3CEFA|nr:serine/threonine-protein kinase [Mesorhizobium sp.]RWN56203.1 MAG: serine/threonine protein kinase [Mesorhizobium sp.]RWN76771.1 MAG: serine/threonine protein kinase [Mesorhizobium sp.]RWN81260.1 MAG: serine/threonine protein kinase [Mesorhizobium sp.]RWN90258.1 MAG: serine/threonine protein kinase [Mesorhizobium sp.]RWO15263.1 MAG: serine/threonine protein kinase [Mesorhizobium sp.]
MSADDKTRISPDVATTAVGTQLSGIYELDERIAFGGMGEVYRGHNIQTGDHVAIKIVLPEFARDQTILSLFRKEATILNHLSHDAVVRYHVFTIDPGIGRPYLAMEFVDGQSLFDIMGRGPMPTEDVRKLCHRLASGLSAVHQAGAIHRDLSPDNIILPGGRVDRAKIIDFGIARSATVGGETLIGGKFAGKYNYVSPEQLGLYSGDVSEQSDIYSLGLVLAAALRGKPIDMGGSQYEIVEKRRTVPDLSDIDADFREIVEAMLQPDPQDRPISMADIARATRDDTDEETRPPTSITPRDRTPRTGGTAAPGPRLAGPEIAGPKIASQSPAAAGEQRFVPHVRPALLSEPRPSPVAGPARAVLPKVPAKSARTRSIAIAVLATLAVASGAGVYLSGVMAPSTPTAGDTAFLSPKASKPGPTDSAANSPGDEPAKAVAPEQSRTEATAPPTESQAGADQKLEPARPAEVLSPSEETPERLASEESSEPAASAEISEPAAEEAQLPAENRADAAADQRLEPTRPAEVLSPTEETPQRAAAEDTSEPAAAEAPSPAEDRADAAADQKLQPTPPAEVLSPTEESPVPPRIQVAPMPPADKTSPPAAVRPEIMESRRPDQPASQHARAESQTDDANEKRQQDETAAGKHPGEATIALNVPKPDLKLPPKNALDPAAQRVSWVRDFNGGDCFYATLTSATEAAAAIEGLGTEIQPFERMLSDFQAKFRVEPDISVRLIEPAQCEVTNFLRFLDQMPADKPQLVLDRTTVPSGSPIGGTLVTQGGLISSVLLIDHRGMAFSLDDLMLAQADKATFNIPIDLGAADKAAGKVVPQIIMVITGPQDIHAAAFSEPTPAALLLPRILEEIDANRAEFSATAKYFRLGG